MDVDFRHDGHGGAHHKCPESVRVVYEALYNSLYNRESNF